MNTNIAFRFVTRTLTEDYRVFSDGGSETYSDSAEFEPLRKKGRIIPEEGPCAVLWEESRLIFLTVSAMQRGTKDFANRPIRFSFCEIFTDRHEAWAAFIRIISDFSGSEKVMQSLIREIPRPGGDGENVEFRQEDFIAWLQGKKRGGIKFSACMEGDVIVREGDRWPDLWPPEGTVFKWRGTEDDEISCEPLRIEERRGSRKKPREIQPKPKKPRKIPKWLMPVSYFVIGFMIGAGIYEMMRPKNIEPLFEVYAADDISVSEGGKVFTLKKGEAKSFNSPVKITISKLESTNASSDK